MFRGLAAAFAIIVFVTAHEAGHFFAAKATGMKATEFFFGFGPKLWSKMRGETEYGVKLVPLGGYVRIVGMNPLEEVPAEDVGRTYREKKFWEKSVVVLAGVGMNFLIAFLIFFGIAFFSGYARVLTEVGEVIPTTKVEEETIETPAALSGIEPGDVIVAIGPHRIATWEDVPVALDSVGGGEVTVVVERDGQPVSIDVDLIEKESTEGSGSTGFLGIVPASEHYQPGLFESIAFAGEQVWDGIGFTFKALGDMLRPSSLAQYVGVLGGDTDVDQEIRPVSPIGIVNIGTQATSSTAFFGVLAFVNVILATINLLPLYPLDGGHFAVAVYERLSGRQANMRKLMPVAAAVIGIFAFLGFVAIILDIVNPISL